MKFALRDIGAAVSSMANEVSFKEAHSQYAAAPEAVSRES